MLPRVIRVYLVSIIAMQPHEWLQQDARYRPRGPSAHLQLRDIINFKIVKEILRSRAVT